MFEGISVALVTPFHQDKLDEAGFRAVARHVLDQGVVGLVATGSTGEGSALTPAERERVWELAVEEAAGRAFVLAGTGAGSTRETIEATRAAAARGVDGCMLVTPPYAKPTQEGLRRHFLTVADAVDVPIVLYNVPGRTGVNLDPRIAVELGRHERIVAIKEASGSLAQATEILRGGTLTVLSGDDPLALGHFAVGAQGLVSVAGHLVGDALTEMHTAYRSGDGTTAAAIHQRLHPLVEALFLESNPGPLKAALARLGLIRNELRLPLVSAGVGTVERLGIAMEAAGVRLPAAATG